MSPRHVPLLVTMTTFRTSRYAATLALDLLACLACLGTPACKANGSAGSHDTGRDAGATAAAASGLPAPLDVASPPADATKTASGLASKVLVRGTGADHPSRNDSVRVNYTGWTTDGRMFDSSVVPLQPGRKAEPMVLSLGRVIPGWTEGVQLMVVGEKRRLWIPEELAYKGRPGAPPGMLVFDIELLDFTAGPKPPDDVATPPPDAEKTKSGLASKVTQKGTGAAHPQVNDAVRVNYSIWQIDGTLLDASKDKPSVRPVTGVSEGWGEGMRLMVVGEKRTLWVPAALALPRPPGAAPSDVTMVVELLEIIPGPKTPPDVKAPPKDATVEKDGLATKVLTKGTGTIHPIPTHSVTVQYAGWTTDGKMFDSSYWRGQAATFGVGAVIPGWTEALQLMVEGEKRRIWIPEPLAYKGRPGAPPGMLVFEVELLKINDAPQRPTLPGAGSQEASQSHP
ncbi:MAG: FKBP-type peptidyl-prolyl cis-trans isomerase [Myxococcota bacterium]|nr:FKBP-type peptidyl-prolyl cis-trans isomerase [Myxococcota bacterium]